MKKIIALFAATFMMFSTISTTIAVDYRVVGNVESDIYDKYYPLLDRVVEILEEDHYGTELYDKYHYIFDYWYNKLGDSIVQCNTQVMSVYGRTPHLKRMYTDQCLERRQEWDMEKGYTGYVPGTWYRENG